jgi:glucokinase
MQQKSAIGVDVGGTNIRMAVVDAAGAIVGILKQPTHAGRDMTQIIGDVARGIETLIGMHVGSREQVSGIGLGMPGFLSLQSGVIHSSPNLPTARETPASSLLQQLTGLPVFMENDANAAAIGEHWVGAGQGARHLLCVTLGTGVGSGVILNHRIWHGSNDLAGELGHTVLVPDGLPCKCGRRGCLEAYVSATGIVARTASALEEGRNSSLGAFGKPDNPLTALAVCEHAEKGDRLARDIFAETGRYLGIALANVLNLLDLEMIIIGGRVAQAGDMLLQPTIHEMSTMALRAAYHPVHILQARLGDHAGVIGAAKTVFNRV